MQPSESEEQIGEEIKKRTNNNGVSTPKARRKELDQKIKRRVDKRRNKEK